MEELGISILAIIIATIANFFLGFLWYTPLFGKVWAKELGLNPDGKPTSGQMVRGLIFGLIGNFLMAFVLAHNNAAWAFVPGMDVMPTVGIILNAAIFTWLGFYLPVDLNRVAWEGASWKLFWINTGYHLVMTLVAATVLTLVK